MAKDEHRAHRGLRSLVGATLLLCLLGAATAAAAGSPSIVSGNLVRNGGAELGRAAVNPTGIVVPAGWKTTTGFTAVAYSAGYGFPDPAASRAITGGKHFFAGGPAGGSHHSSARQIAVVPGAFRKAGVQATVTLSAALGGYSSQLDSATVTATFFSAGSATGSKLGALRVGPVSRARRGGATKLVPVTKRAALPAGTTSIEVVIAASSPSAGYKDGYADNVELRLST